MSRAVHFEIHAANPPAVIDFYRTLFGWSFNKWEAGDYWMIHTGAREQPGIDGGLLPRQGPSPAPGASPNAFVITIDVDDIDALLDRIASGKPRGQVAMPKTAVPGIGWLAYARDPDGNLFGMMQADTTAA